MDWAVPWGEKRLRPWFPCVVSLGGLAMGSLVLLARWLYLHPSNPAIGSTLSLMADFVPMAIATVGIIMSYRTPKKEHHLRTTLILVFCGLFGTGVLSLARLRNEAAHKSEMDQLNEKIASVGEQNGHILTSLLAPKQPTVQSTPLPQKPSETTR